MSTTLNPDHIWSPIEDCDIDALFILPLRIIPFKTEGLARARLVKNGHLDGVMELFSERSTGSGQIAIHDLPRHFNWKEGANHPDLAVLTALAPLPSYDVYSLRRSLRDHGIAVNNHSELKLSEEKNRELTGYMSQFTLPLIKQIYGEAGKDITRLEDLIALFKDPDVKKALAQLRVMAERLKIVVEQIPRFIEDYGDIFMSLSYYYHCLDRLMPLIDGFIESMSEMKKSLQVRHDRSLMTEMERIERLIKGLLNFLTHTFENFAALSQDMWADLSAARFEQVEGFVRDTQAKIGGVLCGLTVKMNAWVVRFPSLRGGGPAARADSS